MGEGRIQCVLVVLRNNGLLIEHVDIDIAISQYLKGKSSLIEVFECTKFSIIVMLE